MKKRETSEATRGLMQTFARSGSVGNAFNEPARDDEKLLKPTMGATLLVLAVCDAQRRRRRWRRVRWMVVVSERGLGWLYLMGSSA